ncbi:hypothetical protein BaRGS_00019367, partial [Batillaria attramentaria]
MPVTSNKPANEEYTCPHDSHKDGESGLCLRAVSPNGEAAMDLRDTSTTRVLSPLCPASGLTSFVSSEENLRSLQFAHCFRKLTSSTLHVILANKVGAQSSSATDLCGGDRSRDKQRVDRCPVAGRGMTSVRSASGQPSAARGRREGQGDQSAFRPRLPPQSKQLFTAAFNKMRNECIGI